MKKYLSILILLFFSISITNAANLSFLILQKTPLSKTIIAKIPYISSGKSQNTHNKIQDTNISGRIERNDKYKIQRN